MRLSIKKESQKNIGMALFTFFFLTVDFRTSLFQSVIIAYGFAALSLFLIVGGTGMAFSGKMSRICFLWILSVVFVITSGEASLIIKYILGLIVMYSFSSSNGSGGKTVNLLMVYGFIFSFASFYFYFFPDVYVNSVVPHLEDYLQTQAVYLIRSNRYPGLTGHYSTNGIYLSFGIGAAFASYISSSKGHWKSISALCVGLGFLALLLIGKRAHLVFSVGACFVIYWIANNRKQKRIVKVAGVVIAFAVTVVVVVNQIPALSNTFYRFVETASSGNFLMSRGGFYLMAYETFLEHPVFGIGWRQMFEIIEHDVHNIYLQLLAENGIVGFLYYTGLLLYGLFLCTKEFSWASKNQELLNAGDYRLLAFSTYYMYFFMVYGLTGNPLYDEQTFYVLMIAYGAIIYAARANKITKKRLVESTKKEDEN